MKSRRSAPGISILTLATCWPMACDHADSPLDSIGTGGAGSAGGSASPGNSGAGTATSGGDGGGATSAGGNTGTASAAGAGAARGVGGHAATGGSGGSTVTTGGATTVGGRSGSAGAVGTGGTEASGGSSAAGGRSSTAGGAGRTGGSAAVGGTSGFGTGGTTGSGAATGTGGATNSGGTTSTGGTTHAGGTSSTGTCGARNSDPFACKFAWGAPSNGTPPSYLDFVSTWVGDEPNGGLSEWSETATNANCGDCGLVQTVAGTNATVVFYAYFIGFQACKQAHYCDCNTSSGATLCTHGAEWIKANRAQIVNAYGQYAKAVHARSPDKPVVWWLEGDFVQYTYNGAGQQTSPLSYAEAGQLAQDITCAIKANEPKAVVAMNHSPWLTDDQAEGFWGAQPTGDLDLIWVQGPGDSGTLTNSGDYNKATANYAWLNKTTGLKIMAETSFAGQGANDRWTTTTAANINARIGEGVISVLVNSPPSNYQSSIGNLSSLSSTCN